MEFAVCLFVRFGNALDVLDNVECAEHVDIDFGGIADKTHNGLANAVGVLRSDVHFTEPRGETVKLHFIAIIF